MTLTEQQVRERSMRAANDNTVITLTRPQAAALCGLTPAGFDVWVRKGIVPPALHGTRRWSRVAVERAVAGGPTAVDVELDPVLRWEAGQNARKA